MAAIKDFYKNLVDNMDEGVYFVDLDRKITYWNRGAEQITGYDSKQVVGRHCSDNILNHVTADGTMLCFQDCPLKACMDDGQTRNADVFLHHARGHRLPVHVRAAPIRGNDGEIVGAVETFNRSAVFSVNPDEIEELRKKANNDRLTGLRNRAYVENWLSGLTAAERKEYISAGILFIDIDTFKHINDTFGHETGDEVLKMVTGTIWGNLRSTDVIGRWGGDEFLVIINEIRSTKELKEIAEKIRKLVAYSRLDIDSNGIAVTVSIGATMVKQDDTPESVIRRADQLMYTNKVAGKNRVAVG